MKIFFYLVFLSYTLDKILQLEERLPTKEHCITIEIQDGRLREVPKDFLRVGKFSEREIYSEGKVMPSLSGTTRFLPEFFAEIRAKSDLRIN